MVLDAARPASPDVEPTHGGLQQMIVIVRHGLVHKGGDLVVGEASFRSGLATASENSEGVAVMAGQRDGDFGIFRGDWGRFQESRLSDMRRDRRA